MSSGTYDRVPQTDSELEEKDVLRLREHAFRQTKWRSICIVLAVCLVASLAANISLFYVRFARPQALYNGIPSQFAHLRRDTPRRTDPDPVYSSLNRTVQDAAWNDPRLNAWALFVALDDAYTVSEGLPHAMRWPWDLSKGVYIPTAAHELHCTLVLRSWINQKQDGVAEADMDFPYGHTMHCLNVLRETVMCNADDLPLYTGRVNENVHYKDVVAGRGMTRMCRNWDALVDWTHERSACYLSANRNDRSWKEIDRYKFCPDGSRPWENRTELQ
ncbi:Hypothetical predicted protein [Lecanosticta acicola]|uniref:Oxidase ustYa n=1 Tax=Lecanosticta acicola TaxID=111012 RepID=A0AAI8YZD9_9PEZI|nr:Hypothetical predicted protein [Lecanosticta acicola]